MELLSRLGVSRLEQKLLVALVLSSLGSVLLFGIRFFSTGSTDYWFMIWNLLLAWLPPLFAVLLRQTLRHRHWQSWRAVTLTILWLGLLPNSFYMLSDLIHLTPSGDISLLFDAVLLFSFIANGFLPGLISVSIIHHLMLKRLKADQTYLVLAVVFLICGFAVYLGRTLRWNSWDLVINPAGVLFDVSDDIINPFSHPQLVSTTGTFFILLSSLYFVAYRTIQLIKQSAGIRR